MACEDRLRILLLNIHNHIPHNMGSYMWLHYKSSPLWVPQILYQKMCGRKCHTGKTTLQNSSMFFTNTAFSITYSLQHLCTHCFIFCLSNRGKNIFEYSLVADIISTLFYGQEHTWFQSCKKMISEGQSHTQNYILPMSNVLEVDTTVSNICPLSPHERT
jgi:hypothetical protein